MAWNLNNYSNEYELFNSQTEENISMFGLTVTYIKSEGQNLDNIFGEYSHKKLNQGNVFKDVPVLPENNEDFDMLGNTFSKFGFVQTETFHCYISANEADKLGYTDFRREAVGDLILLPNNKKFEITFVDHEVVGTNNMFPYTNNKNVYMLKTQIWSYNGDDKEEGNKVTDENGVETIDDKLDNLNFTSLDELFNTDKSNDDIPVEEKVTTENKTNQQEEASKINVQKPSPFGDWD